MPDVYLLILTTLASYRVAVFLAEDALAERIRTFWLKRFPSESFTYNVEDVTDGYVYAWPFQREVVKVELKNGWQVEWKSRNVYELGTLAECFFCISVWVAVPFTFLVTPEPIYMPVVWLAIAAGSEVIHRSAR